MTQIPLDLPLFYGNIYLLSTVAGPVLVAPNPFLSATSTAFTHNPIVSMYFHQGVGEGVPVIVNQKAWLAHPFNNLRFSFPGYLLFPYCYTIRHTLNLSSLSLHRRHL